MTDKFLIHFALGTLVTISFLLQHGIQIAIRRLNFSKSKDKNGVLFILILLGLLCSAGLIVEIIKYALSK